jgi:PAS domain S-box-containing protein
VDLAAVALAILKSNPRGAVLVLDSMGRCVAEFGALPAELVERLGAAGTAVGLDVPLALGPHEAQARELIANVLAERGGALRGGVASLPGGALEFEAQLWKLEGLPLVACQLDRIGRIDAVREELAASRSRLEAFAFQAADVVIEIDETGAITYASERTTEWGIPPQTLVGTRLRELMQQPGAVGGVEAAAAVAAVDRFLAKQDALEPYSIDLVDRSGAARRLVSSGSWYTNASGERRGVMMFRDSGAPETTPTARAHALSSLAGSLVDAVVELTSAGVIVAATPLPATWSGSGEALEGRRLGDYLHPEDLERADRVLGGGASSASFEPALFRWRAVGGGWRWVETRSVAYTPERGETRFIAVGRDVTDEFRSALGALDEAPNESEFSLAEGNLAVLAGGIAHDFNNLLTVALGVTDLIAEQLPPDSPMRSPLAEVVTASRQAADLARQLLGITNRRKLNQVPCDLNAVIGEVSGLLRSAIPKRVRLEFTPSPKPLWIVADAAQLRQVLLNLVTNAGEAIGSRAGSIAIRTHSFPEGSAASNARFAVVVVRDDGPGMDAETRRRIFEPAFTTKATGHGLGLAVVRSVIDRHKGWIVVEAAPERGTEFRIGFPLLAEEVATSERRIQSELLLAPRPGGGSVLIVDDDDNVRRVSATMLRLANFSVYEAANAEAMREILRSGVRLDCAVVDLVMPDADGLVLVDELRRAQPGLEVVICSGAIERLPQRGDLELIEKPFRYAQLIETVWRCIDRSRLSDRPPHHDS